MKFQLISLFFILTANLNIYDTKPTGSSTQCENSKNEALADLHKGKIEFLLQGGIAPVHVEGQEKFEIAYKLRYHNLGCTIPKGLCIDVYNREVAHFLDEKHGKNWRKEVRKDVTGLQP